MDEGFVIRLRGMFVAPSLAAGNERGVRRIKDSSRVGKQPKEVAYLTKHLTIARYASLLARTGAGAMKSTKEHAPDVVLLEIDLSDIEGIDVVKAIRENSMRAGTLIVAISAFPYMKARCFDSGCNGFIRSLSKLSICSHTCESSPKL